MTVREVFKKTWWIACIIVVIGMFLHLPVFIGGVASIYIWIDIILFVGGSLFKNPMLSKIDNFQLWK